MAFGLDDPEKQRAALFVLLLGGGLYLFYQFVWSPVHDERVVTVERLQSLQRTNDQVRALTQPQRMRELQKRQAEAQVQLAAFETMLPQEAEVPGLLEDVAQAALREDVEIIQFTPLDAGAGPYLTELPYEVQVQGEYHDIGRFVAAVSNLPRLVRPSVEALQSVQIEPATEDEDAVYTVLGSLRLSTFMTSTRIPDDDAAERPAPPQERLSRTAKEVADG